MSRAELLAALDHEIARFGDVEDGVPPALSARYQEMRVLASQAERRALAGQMPANEIDAPSPGPHPR